MRISAFRRWLLVAPMIGATAAWSSGPGTERQQTAVVGTTRAQAGAGSAETASSARSVRASRPRPRVSAEGLAPTVKSARAKQSASAAAMQVPALPYRYAGQAESDGRKLVLLLRDQRSHIAAVGDVLDGTYRVDEILPSGARLTYIPLNIHQLAVAGAAPAPGRPVELLLNVPAEATPGNTFRVVAGISPADAAQSAQLLITYDVEALQLLDVDATGSAMPMLSWTPGVIRLGFDAESGGATGPTPIQFLVIANSAGSTQIGLTAEGKDGNGNALPVTRSQRRTLLIRRASQDVAAAN